MSVGGDSGIWGCRESLMTATPCPGPGSDGQKLPNSSSVQIVPRIKGPDTVFEEIEKANFIC